jgi:NAD-dependent deacetylase
MKVFFFTGAGISAESGIPTYRDANGLWYDYKVTEVATQQAWLNNPKKVLDFFNMMRKRLNEHEPNAAHLWIAELSKKHEVVVVTQNVDDLHERAGSPNVIHLHGCLRNKRTSNVNRRPILYPYDSDINIGDLDPDYGAQFRPDVVLFGEDVDNMVQAIKQVDDSDALVIVGTTLEVFPAARLVQYFLHDRKPVYYIDPNPNDEYGSRINYIQKSATEGVLDLASELEKLTK